MSGSVLATTTGTTDSSDGLVKGHTKKGEKEKIVSNPAMEILTNATSDPIKKSVCQIILREIMTDGPYVTRASGFLFKYQKNKEDILGLMTCNHVISEGEFYSEKVTCKIMFESLGKLHLDVNFRDCKDFVTEPELDATFFRLSKEIEDCLKRAGAVWLTNVADVTENDQIFIVQHPVGKDNEYPGAQATEKGIVNSVFEYDILHKVDTDGGSSGSPVVKYRKKEAAALVGLHREAGLDGEEFNIATRIEDILKFLGGTACSGVSKKMKKETVYKIDDKGAPDNNRIRDGVRANYSVIVNHLDPKGYLLNLMLEKNVLTLEDYEKLDRYPAGERGKELLHILFEGNHPHAFEVLLMGLEKEVSAKWMVDIICGRNVDGPKLPEPGNPKYKTLAGLDNAAIRSRIYNNYAALVKNFDPRGAVLDKLKEANVLLEQEHRDLNSYSNDEHRGSDFFQLLLKESHGHLPVLFLDCILKIGDLDWMVEIIADNAGENENQTLSKPGSENNSTLKQNVRNSFDKLIFDPKDTILNKLFQAKIISAAKFNELRKEPVQEKRRQHLLQYLLNGSNPRSFVVLLNIIRQTEYAYLADYITGKKTVNNQDTTTFENIENDELKKRMRAIYSEFAKGFNPSRDVLEGLYAKNILIGADFERLCNSDERDRGGALLQHLFKTTHPRSVVALLECMSKDDGYKHKVAMIVQK